MRTSLTMTRKGEFTVVTKGRHPCGMSNPLKMKYEVKVQCSVLLDDRGFLFDQITIARFFDSIVDTDKSCENFAISCSRQLFRNLQHENPDCEIEMMRLTLSPYPFLAEMCFEYEKDFPKEILRDD